MTEEHRNWIAKRIIDAIRAQPDDCIATASLAKEVLAAKPRMTKVDYLVVLLDLALRCEIRYMDDDDGNYRSDVIMLTHDEENLP